MRALKSIWSLLYDNPWPPLVATMALWGGNAVAARAAAGEVTPMTLVFLRWVMVCIVLVALFHEEILREREMLWGARRRILLMAGFGFTGFNVLFYIAGYYTTAVNLTLLQTVIPVFVLAGSAVFRGVPVTFMQVIGMLVTLTGIVLIATHGEPARIRELEFNRGDLMVLAAAALYAGYTLGLFDRPPISALAFFAGLAIGALVSSFPFFLFEVFGGGNFRAPTAKGWAILAFVALGPSFVGQLLYMRGVELIGPGRAGLFINLTPVFGALFAVLILGEDFHPYHAIAMVIALSGIWLAERRR
ncbi:MAG: DMT family transporter [Methylobacteriaceae bacterium]|nr:DMT family transporter [Methylobacteriaceae bacterium]